MDPWSVLLLVILGFYAQSRKITQRHDENSDEYRFLREYFESVDMILSRATILLVNNHRNQGGIPFISLHRPDLANRCWRAALSIGPKVRKS